MKTRLVSSDGYIDGMLNKAIEELEKKGNRIVDIKFSTDWSTVRGKSVFSALILYEKS